MTPLVNGFVDIIEVNIGMWNIAFYSVIAIITFGFIAFLFSIAFLLFAWSRKIQGKSLINNGDDKNES